MLKLVGIFIFNKLSNIIDKNSIGLYRDGSLGMFDKLAAPKIEKKKKKIIKIFKDGGLSKTITTNITSVDWLSWFNFKFKNWVLQIVQKTK